MASRILILNGTQMEEGALASALLLLSGGTLTGALVPAGHGTATNPEVVAVCYGTGDPPSAAGVPEGTLYVKYTA